MTGPGWEILEGDCAEGLDSLSTERGRTVIITDPPWPNAPEGMFPGLDIWATFAAAAVQFPRLARRAVIELGCMSDPRMLASVPKEMPLFRVCWLRYARPSYFGTVLNTGDVAYVFGSREAPPGRTVVPGEMCAVDTSDMPKGEHPCPRPLEFVSWLVTWLTGQGDTVIDPFCGSGTTGVACIRLGRRFIGIEKDPTYAALARERLQAESLGLSLRAARAGQLPMFGGLP